MGERRLLQVVVGIACLVPILTGLDGVVRGAAMFKLAASPVNLDSHFRYLSGIFLMMGFAFVSTIPAIEHQGRRFRLLGAMVIMGGFARALSWAAVGPPGLGHKFGLVMELVVVPLLVVWQARVERIAARDLAARS